ncbi:MAG TPA: glutathione S-transferase family protein [Kofleriaceae bacterium]|jgi:glutathione S-transferase|nr:glutathione S-transferase family protein [Kofleriaceae bacterium]
MTDLVVVGRSSSHFTRTVRIFALELGVPHRFEPVFDLTVLDAGAYAGNPALKVPVLVTGDGPLFGTENICRELVRRSGRGAEVVLRGAVADRRVANAEELVLHAMSTEVSLIVAQLAGDARLAPAKLERSLDGSLRHLDDHLDDALAALPAPRRLSFLEVAVFCLVTHLPFRKIRSIDRHPRLVEFCRQFGARAGARATEYAFDQP